MKTVREVGIVGYGAYVPRLRVLNKSISSTWGKPCREKILEMKSFPDCDEDTTTIAIEAARNALLRARIDLEELGALWVGTESKPYAVKPTSTIVADVLGVTPRVLAADLEFACKAGTEAMQSSLALVGSGMSKYAMAIGADTAQSQPGDDLEYTASAGGAAFVMGPADESVAVLKASASYVTDTPDFFRRAHMRYPEHGYRFTGKPAYFHHSMAAANAILKETNTEPKDYRYCVFHQPNRKFPQDVAKKLGFTESQYKDSLCVQHFGNAYAGSSLLGLHAVLDLASKGDRILMVSYGSGAGSDAFVWEVSDKLSERKSWAPNLRDYLDQHKVIESYGTYLKHMQKLLLR